MSLNFDRIEHLISPEALRDKLVAQIGVGSGGAPVCDHLTMNGVRRWVLYDPDRLGPENLVKHPRPRSSLGGLKVEIQRDWILDRNPEAEVRAVGEDVFESQQFRNDVVDSDLILCWVLTLAIICFCAAGACYLGAPTRASLVVALVEILIICAAVFGGWLALPGLLKHAADRYAESAWSCFLQLPS